MKLTHSKLCQVAVKWLRKVKKQNCKYHTYPITGSEIACYNGVKWADTFYVEVATGKYHFAYDLIKEYGRQKLCKLLAEGKFVNEVRWDKMQEKKRSNDAHCKH